jgi:hypothetical protein
VKRFDFFFRFLGIWFGFYFIRRLPQHFRISVDSQWLLLEFQSLTDDDQRFHIHEKNFDIICPAILTKDQFEEVFWQAKPMTKRLTKNQINILQDIKLIE